MFRIGNFSVRCIFMYLFMYLLILSHTMHLFILFSSILGRKGAWTDFPVSSMKSCISCRTCFHVCHCHRYMNDCVSVKNEWYSVWLINYPEGVSSQLILPTRQVATLSPMDTAQHLLTLCQSYQSCPMDWILLRWEEERLAISRRASSSQAEVSRIKGRELSK